MGPSSGGIVLYWIYEKIQSTKQQTTTFIVNDENSDTN